jgi:tetratricopeptide (TPR) repeat protein
MTGSADNIQTYREMLKLDPRSRVFALLAEELCAAGEWEKVAEVCRQGLLYHPDHLRSRVLLGWALMEMGEADQSEQVLLEAVEDIRKNTIIFKLLSEFAIFSGNPVSAAEYTRIYEAFETLGAAGPPPAGPGPETKKEASDWNDFKTEAIEELQGPDLDIAGPETPSKMGIEDILTHLSQRIEGRFTREAAPTVILSEEDRDFLKRELTAALSC